MKVKNKLVTSGHNYGICMKCGKEHNLPRRWNKGLTKNTDPRLVESGSKQSSTKHNMYLKAWNKGLTKETDMRVTKYGMSQRDTKLSEEFRSTYSAWNKGLKKETDPRITSYAKSCSKTKQITRFPSPTKGKKMSDITKEKIRIVASNRHGTFPRRDTDIECIMQSEFRRRGILFETDVTLINRTRADIFLEPNVAIFCDGDYWHKYPEGREKDRDITKRLLDSGYCVFRFWEKDIKKDVQGCVDKIFEYSKPNVILHS